MDDDKLLALLEYIAKDIYWNWNLLYTLPQIDCDELVSWGYIGYLKAKDRYDSSLGFKLSTYAQWWIRAEIKSQLMKQLKLKYRNNVEYSDTVNYLPDHSNCHQPHVISHDNYLDIVKLMKVLTKRERKYLKMYFFDGMSEQEIGTNTRYSKQNIDVITDKSIYKMRVRFCKSERNAGQGENGEDNRHGKQVKATEHTP